MSTRSSSPVGIHYIYRNIRPTPLAVYIIEYAFRISRYGVFQGFPLGEVLLDHGIQYVTRRVFHSSMVQYFQVPYSGYTLSPRHNWPSVVLLIYSQYSLYFGLQYYSSTLSIRSTRYMYSILWAYLQHLLRRWRLLLLLLLLLLPLWRLCCYYATLSRSVRSAHAVTHATQRFAFLTLLLNTTTTIRVLQILLLMLL